MQNEKLCMGCMREKGDAAQCPHCAYLFDSEPDSLHHLIPGTMLDNKYLVGRALGQGGFGITYLAWDINLAVKLAIKEYFPQGLLSRVPGQTDVQSFNMEAREQFSFGLDRFLNEAKTLARFSDYPNIVTVRDFFRSNGTAYMVMNYVEGVTFDQYLKQKGGRVSFEQAVLIMMPVLDALKEVHVTGILHRDVSPDNIFINTAGRVTLIDFGAARQEMQQKSRHLSVIMKVGYSPEEQYRSRGKQGPWTDIYAVAATFYRAIAGEAPPESMDRLAEDILVPPSELGLKIEPHAEQALLKALAVRAEDRYQQVEEFQKELLYGVEETGSEEQIEAAPKVATKEEKLEDKPSKRPEKRVQIDSSPGPVRIAEEKSSAPLKNNKSLTLIAIAGGILLIGIASWLSAQAEEDNAVVNEPGSEIDVDEAIEENRDKTLEELLATDFSEYEEIPWNEGAYQGELKDGFPQGLGIWKEDNGNEYIGEFRNGKFHGLGRFTWSEGSEWPGDVYEGEWKNDYQHGYGTVTSPNGLIYVGEFEYDYLHGDGKMVWPEGDTYEGEWIRGDRTGWGVYTWPNGDRYEGDSEGNVFTGWGTYIWANGDKYVGNFTDDLFNGYGTYYYNDGSKYEGYWKNDKYSGEGTYTYPDGTTIEGVWEDDDLIN